MLNRPMLRTLSRILPLVAPTLLLAGCSAGAGDESAVRSSEAATVIAATPPMGWNSWNTFACNVTESVVRAQADAIVSSGLRDAGYLYVNPDDCWMAPQRDPSGALYGDPARFPGGIAALATYVHARGLKLGIYESPGPQTCEGRSIQGLLTGSHPGSQGHEAQDAQTFAAWGVDYLKYDRCTETTEAAEGAFARMGTALAATGRPIVYSINPDGAPHTKPWSTYANMWRTTPDIDPTWAAGINEGWWSTGMTNIIDLNAPLASQATPGHWNDPDMLEVGVSKRVLFGSESLTDTEGQAHFSMWAMMAAPLIAGNDVTKISAATKSTLTNTEVIAIDQDALGVQGTRVASAGGLEVWRKPLSGGDVAIALFNRSGSTATITAKWTDLGLGTSSAQIRDLWAHTDRGTFHGQYSASVPAHGVVVLRAHES